MKKLLLALTAMVVVIILLACFWNVAPKTVKFAVGPALPPGKVAPQLVSCTGTAILLAPDGSLWTWGGPPFVGPGVFGSPGNSVPRRFGSDTDWRSISASQGHTLAVKSDGSLWGWGSDFSGQLAQSNRIVPYKNATRIGTDTNWAQVGAGAGHSIGLKKDGSLWGWGQNESGQVGDGTNVNQFTVTSISPDNDWRNISIGAFNSYALKSNGTVWGWGLDAKSPRKNNLLSPQQIDPGTNWASISAAEFSLLALKSDGTLWIYGQNAGLSAPQDAKNGADVFMQIGRDHDWQSVSAGETFFFARKRDGSWWDCGQTDHNQLGLDQQTTPTMRRLEFNFEPWALGTGYGNCVLLTKDGVLWSWGERLGTQNTTFSERLRQLWYRVSALLSRNRGQRPLTLPQPLIDRTPYKLWELPNSVRRSLRENVPSETQSATNTAAAK